MAEQAIRELLERYARDNRALAEVINRLVAHVQRVENRLAALEKRLDGSGGDVGRVMH